MEPNTETFDRCIGEHELSAITHLSVLTLRKWRSLRRGPRFMKLGGAVRYRVSDVESWLAAQAR
jgi:predicted DNA-binding transcriptional regulator AlpA